MPESDLLYPDAMQVKWPNREAVERALIIPGGTGCELGVLRGNHAMFLLKTFAPKKLYLVDWWKAQVPEHQGRRDRQYQNVCTMFGAEIASGVVSVIRSKTEECSDVIPFQSLDWLVIDACHTKEGCISDLTLYVPKVKAHGIIMCHDYERDSVRDSRTGYGVFRAVTHFVETHPEVAYIGRSGERRAVTGVLRKVV